MWRFDYGVCTRRHVVHRNAQTRCFFKSLSMFSHDAEKPFNCHWLLVKLDEKYVDVVILFTVKIKPPAPYLNLIKNMWTSSYCSP